MRVGEVARRLDVSDKAVYALIASGKLRAYRIGGAYRVDDRQLREFLDAAVTGPGSPPTPPAPAGVGWGCAPRGLSVRRKAEHAP